MNPYTSKSYMMVIGSVLAVGAAGELRRRGGSSARWDEYGMGERKGSVDDRLSKSLKLRDGTEFRKGTSAVIKPSEHDSVADVTIGDRTLRLKYTSLHRYFGAFDAPPDMEEMYDSDVQGGTPVGTFTDPDSYDSDGWPSWAMAMGVI